MPSFLRSRANGRVTSVAGSINTQHAGFQLVVLHV